MPSALKARQGRPSYREMKAQLDALRKPLASRMEAIFDKYYTICKETGRREVVVDEPDVNWKALVMSLPKPQCTEVLGSGIRRILLKETECIYEGVFQFHVERRDITQARFDYREAYDDPYHNYKDKSFKDDVETALRAAVLPQLVQFKEMMSKDHQMELVSHISGVALPWERAVVQHFPLTLDQLVTAFLNEHQLRIENIKLEYDEHHAYRVQDPELLDKWCIFHRSQAHYRVISTDEAMEQDHL
mmetsp:Transcript_35494/g.110725  ORF Transcript_35494/g.110725 Transcript_35494/m.110725 type:complete len:246 (+) Transcript_35494:89-826(+)